MQPNEALKRKLLEKRTEVIHRVELITKDKQRSKGPLPADLDDQAVDLENQEVLNQLDDTERQELNLIDQALHRMEVGTYGNCQACGQQISAKRLEALPFANQCITCSQAN